MCAGLVEVGIERINEKINKFARKNQYKMSIKKKEKQWWNGEIQDGSNIDITHTHTLRSSPSWHIIT